MTLASIGWASLKGPRVPAEGGLGKIVHYPVDKCGIAAIILGKPHPDRWNPGRLLVLVATLDRTTGGIDSVGDFPLEWFHEHRDP